MVSAKEAFLIILSMSFSLKFFFSFGILLVYYQVKNNSNIFVLVFFFLSRAVKHICHTRKNWRPATRKAVVATTLFRAPPDGDDIQLKAWKVAGKGEVVQADLDRTAL